MLTPSADLGSRRSRHVGAGRIGGRGAGERNSGAGGVLVAIPENATVTAMSDPVAVRDAATVMLVRDATAGVEVFMLRRNLTSGFVAGAYVFPGGAVDDADRHADLEQVCDGRSDAQAS